MKKIGFFFTGFYYDLLIFLRAGSSHASSSSKKRLFKIFSPIMISLCILIYLLLGVVFAATGCLKVTEFYSSDLQEELSRQLLRFHVIANSDSDTDQEVKMKVKETIISYLEPILSKADDKTEAMSIISGELPTLTEMANEVLSDHGFSYEATATLSSTTFPVKVYGDITLPPGEYDALRIELGEAQGKNWWCIMYPQLCFIDSTYTVIPKESKAKLKYILTDEEYTAILSDDAEAEEYTAIFSDDIEIEVKFKFIEWLEDLFK